MNEFPRVEDDEIVVSCSTDHRKENGGGNEGNRNGKFNRSKRKRNEDGFKGVNTVFTKPIHKIMFNIQDKPYFEWLRAMGGNPATRDKKLRCSYHKDFGHKTENCLTLKKFLEGLVNKGHLAEYIKGMEK